MRWCYGDGGLSSDSFNEPGLFTIAQQSAEDCPRNSIPLKYRVPRAKSPEPKSSVEEDGHVLFVATYAYALSHYASET